MVLRAARPNTRTGDRKKTGPPLFWKGRREAADAANDANVVKANGSGREPGGGAENERIVLRGLRRPNEGQERRGKTPVSTYIIYKDNTHSAKLQPVFAFFCRRAIKKRAKTGKKNRFAAFRIIKATPLSAPRPSAARRTAQTKAVAKQEPTNLPCPSPSEREETRTCHTP